MSDTDTKEENSRLITLMLQVATMDGKLDVMIGSLAERVRKLEERNNKSAPHTISIIAILISGVMLFITIGGKLV